MSSNTDGVGAVIVVAMLLAAIAAGLMVAFILLLRSAILFGWFLAFVAFSWTFVCLFAWQRPFQLGRIYIDPANARAFVKRGIFGALMTPLFLFVCDHFLDLTVRWDWFGYFAMGGYTAFSVGIEYLFARRMDVPYVRYEVLPVQAQLPSPEQKLLLPDKTHRFATWDDEEERG